MSRTNPFHATGKTKDGKRVEIRIKQSEITGRWLCLTSVNGTDIQNDILTVWSSTDRALSGTQNIFTVIANFTTQQLNSLDYWQFLKALDNDDDEAIAVIEPLAVQ